MPHNKLNISGARADVLSWVTHDMTHEEHDMLRNVSRLPCLYKHVALMPDAHLGKGSMVGSVIATKDAVIPATVGVDIGCGMMAVKTPFKSGILDGKMAEFRHEIRGHHRRLQRVQESVDEASRWEGWSRSTICTAGSGPQRTSMVQLGTLGAGNTLSRFASIRGQCLLVLIRVRETSVKSLRTSIGPRKRCTN